MAGAEVTRAFIALSLPEDVQDTLAELGAGVPVGRPVPAENLHLTLVFLGDVTQAELAALDEALQGLRAAPAELAFQGWETLGGRHPKVLALAARGPEALQAEVLRRVRAAGLTPERRRFRPHVTLTRLPRRLAQDQAARLAGFLGAAGWPDMAPVTVGQVTLFQSHLTPEGARYTPLAQYPLTG
ncbi:MAG TPA: RNA 2',3'-cyclic phosphodiesterase [Aliiroseovarius sp.]|nr:RNA 2',3'-cyclic phosphodiesterase [Aliiroseovarius sp.]